MSKGTFDMATVPPPYEGVDAGEWQAMVARGAAKGQLLADEVTHVLRKVELTPDVIVGVKTTLESVGIVIDEGVDDLHDDTPAVGIERSTSVEDTEGVLARRRRRRSERMNADRSDTGNTADTVPCSTRPSSGVCCAPSPPGSGPRAR